MKIRILCVGKMKESYLREGAAEYKKRLSAYCRITEEVCTDEKTPDQCSPTERDIILNKEGDRLLGLISPGDYVIALAINGSSYTSEAFAAHLDGLMLRGKSTIDFVIGGSLGLSDKVLSRADESVSFSAMTFPHQLMRVILLEQIYRAFRINRNEPYHK